ncbi:MAG: GNAT family N-acetyltransferase [Candidatus Omnitrophica bacterium]|nr:GNAT family N-acetyltransferase [Candidatus Omnitrophota bacterium]
MKENLFIYPSKIEDYYRKFGLNSLLKKIFFKMMSPFFIYYETITFSRELSLTQKEITPKIKVDIGTLLPQDLKSLKKMTKKQDSVNTKLQSGEICFVAKHNEKIIGYMWAALGPQIVNYVPERVYLAKSEAYIHAAKVAPDYRGKGIFPAILNYICSSLKEKGYHKIIAKVYSDNAASIKSFLKAGFLTIEKVKHLGLFFDKKVFYTIKPIKNN